jgi:hypothetical protein
VSLSDDLPPPRRPLFFPVVIATTFLSIIGISAGILLANERDRREAQAPVNTDNPSIVTTRPAPGPSSAPALDGESCRWETLNAAAQAGYPGPLRLVLRLRTKRSDVYICRSASDQFFYHANNGRDRWVEGETALFLTDVEQRPDDYLATAGNGTTFSVNADRLEIEYADGRPTETQKAIT